MKPLLCTILCFLLLFSCIGCKEDTQQSTPSIALTSAPPVVIPSSPLSDEEQITDRDRSGAFDPASATTLTLPQKGEQLSITQEGVYLLKGTGTGQIFINATVDAKIQLVLQGVTLHNETSAPIYVKQANKVFITLAEDTENTLSAGETFTQTDENKVDGVIFAKDDLTLNGSGKLTLTALGSHGIVAKDDLVFGGGQYHITATGHGISANNSIRVAEGTFAVTAQKDGMKVEHDTDETKGYLYVEQGNFTITANQDALSASGICQIQKGDFTLTTKGTQSTESAKGLKAGNDLFIQAGTFTLNTTDDGFHSNQNLTIQAGTFTIASGDDGMHADGDLTLAGGTVTITNSYEGLEGHTVTVAGGTHTITASDDGINSAGGNDQSGYGGFGGDQFAVDENAFIHIADGTLTIHAQGDGVDSNGIVRVSGGQTYVYGPTNGGNGALDGNGSKEISGGIFVAVGSSQMAENFDLATQGAALVSLNGSANTPLTLTDQQGTALITCTPSKTYQCAVVSCPQMVQGGSYTLSAGNATTTFTLNELVYSQITGGMGMPGGGPGGMPGGGMPGGGPGGMPGGGMPGR